MHLKTRLFLIISITINLTTATKTRFPNDFKFGVATSAYQIEGAWNLDGKGPNMWDEITHNRSYLINDRSTGDLACDSYHKWEEDITLIKNLGVDFYRFSVSWPRIFPEGYITKVNPSGIRYYNQIIDALIENGIEPVVTLYHWDLPTRFSAVGGWTNPIIVDAFASYSRKIFDLFGDRVKTWITINEPRLMCNIFKGVVGEETPNFPTGIAEYACAYNLIKAHAEAYHIYDEEFRPSQKGRVAITLDMTWWQAENSTNPDDVAQAEQNMQFDIGIFANPVFNFDFPKVVIDRVKQRSEMEGFPLSRLPKLTYQEKMRIKNTYDFLGINFYFTLMVKAKDEATVGKPNIDIDSGGTRYFDPDWKPTGLGYFKVVPSSLRKLLNWVKTTYNNPEIIITENGYADNREILEDEARIEYYRGYLNATLQAIHEDHVNVKGYTAWTLMDNFEWAYGYEIKFGLYHVNFSDPNRPRVPKKSVEYFKGVTRTRTIN